MLTRAYRDFRLGFARTADLLKFGLLGIFKEQTQLEKLLQTVSEGLRDPAETRSARRVRTEDGRTLIDLRMPAEDWRLIQTALEHGLKQTDELTFQFNGILLVAIWGGFETYIQGVLTEIYKKHPDRLGSERVLTMQQIIDARHDILGYVIEQELGHVGSLNMTELFRYLRNKLRYSFPDERRVELEELYFIRNVFGHNTGFVRPGQRHRVPSQIAVVNEQIKIPHGYLLSASKQIEVAVEEFERYILKRWFDAEMTFFDPRPPVPSMPPVVDENG